MNDRTENRTNTPPPDEEPGGAALTPEGDSETSATDRPLTLPKVIRFDALVRCGDEVWIEHQGQIYRLRRTRQDKLILTK
ncbi:MAG TPA: hemin uptake protein HemP [Pirellulaceae bacterium]|nr:hemin uptake protein HemP [Pirellulaceae bacterium]